MELRFAQSHRKYEAVFPALFLGAILYSGIAALGWLRLLPAALVGAALPLIPGAKGRRVQAVLWGILAVWLLTRFPSVWDGGKLLANRMFALSEQAQSYEYRYFLTSGESAVEAVLWLSCLAGALCALLGNKVNLVLCGGWVIAMAYFGVTPGTVPLAALALAGLLTALPGQRRWFYGLTTGILVVGIALAATRLAPEPSKAVSALDDRLRDTLAAASVAYAQEPVPTEVPEPELVPQPETERKQPDHGVQKAVVNILFLLLAALTLALLFIPAVSRDRVAKRSAQARAGLDAPDHGAAIRAMYLYAQRWRQLSDAPPEIPGEVYAIWQEAAYSDHAMSEAQRETLRAYMEETAKAVWQAADLRKRLHIQYRICL